MTTMTPENKSLETFLPLIVFTPIVLALNNTFMPVAGTALAMSGQPVL